MVPLSVRLWEMSKNALGWWRFVVGLFIGVASVCGLVMWFHYPSGCGKCPKTLWGGGVLLWVVHRGCLGVWTGDVVPLSVGLWEMSKNALGWWRFVVGLFIGVASVCGLVMWFHYPSGCGKCPKTLWGGGVLLWGCSSGLPRCVDW